MSITLPEEVRAFLRSADELRDEPLRINPLTPERSASVSARYRDIPIFAELGLVVLDDANDSNPFCLVTSGPAAGMVVHVCHDGETELSYPSLAEFLHALRLAHQQRLDIDALPHAPIPAGVDQSFLADHIRALLTRDDADAPTLLVIHLPLLDPRNVDLLADCAEHDDFLIRESAAMFLANHPLAEHRAIAEKLSLDRYQQVASPARQARSAIARLRSGRH
ncbi:MAG: SMI1/KNR4 family protein [Polyangiaceae bacterium]|nr:SMI1/KNR4 family protein [Polyangiaceae bacterium]